MKLVQQPGFYDRLSQQTAKLANGLKQKADAAGIPMSINYVGGMFGFFFTEENNIEFFEQVTQCDQERFKRFYHGMLDRGVYLAPSAYEAGFVSAAHGDDEIEATLAAAELVLASL